jgi:hypothetical protein
MKPKHSCGTELDTMRYYDYKEGKTTFQDPIAKTGGEWMWCPKCKMPALVEVTG